MQQPTFKLYYKVNSNTIASSLNSIAFFSKIGYNTTVQPNTNLCYEMKKKTGGFYEII